MIDDRGNVCGLLASYSRSPTSRVSHPSVTSVALCDWTFYSGRYMVYVPGLVVKIAVTTKK